MMEKINQFVQKTQQFLQFLVDTALGLAFQPIYALLSIIEAFIEIFWGVDEEMEEETEYPEIHQVKGFELNCKDEKQPITD